MLWFQLQPAPLHQGARVLLRIQRPQPWRGGAGSPRVCTLDPRAWFQAFQRLKRNHDELLSNLAFKPVPLHHGVSPGEILRNFAEWWGSAG